MKIQTVRQAPPPPITEVIVTFTADEVRTMRRAFSHQVWFDGAMSRISSDFMAETLGI